MRAGIGIYVKHSDKAVELYKKAFGLTLGYHVLNRDGTYYHSELYKGDDEILSVVESHGESRSGNTVQIGMTLDGEDEVRYAFGVLSEGGKIDMEICELPWSPCAASVIDAYGVWWYISAPQHHPSEDWTPET